MAGILVYALHYEGAFNKNSLGAVSEAADQAVAVRSRASGDLGARPVAQFVVDALADKGDAQRRLDRYLALRGVGLGAADELKRLAIRISLLDHGDP